MVDRFTRREWHRLVIGGLLGAPLAARGWAQEPDSTVAGVRIGAQSYSFRDRSVDQTIAAMKDCGLSFCELWQGHVETSERIAAPEGAKRRDALRAWRVGTSLELFREIREHFEAAGITLTAYNLSFRDDFTDEEIRRGFEMARALGVDVITASSTLSIMARVHPIAKEFGIRVGVHNHSKISSNEFATPDDFAAAMKMSDIIAVNLDIGHFTAANFDAVAYLEQHHERIVSLHVKDRRRDQGPNVPFGNGDTPIAAVLQRLRDRKWPIPAQIEYEYGGDDTVVEVRRCLEYCRTALKATPGAQGFSPASETVSPP